MRKAIQLLISIFALLLAQPLLACSLCSGNSYVGAYSTGGYNLYSFATDLYTIVDTTYYVSPISTGGCGSLLGSCNSCYDSASLYGTSSSNPTNSLINQLLINQITQNTAQMCMMSGMCNPINPYLASNNPYSPLIPPINPVPGGYPNPFYPPVVGPNFPYSPNQPYAPYSPTYPTNPYYPWDPYVPPTTQLPYGGCDNVIVMCPAGPNVRPTPGQNPTYPTYVSNPVVNPTTPVTTPYIPPGPTNPIVVNPPSNNPNTSFPVTPITVPSPTPGSNQQPIYQSPVRYQTPRGVVIRTH